MQKEYSYVAYYAALGRVLAFNIRAVVSDNMGFLTVEEVTEVSLELPEGENVKAHILEYIKKSEILKVKIDPNKKHPEMQNGEEFLANAKANTIPPEMKDGFRGVRLGCKAFDCAGNMLDDRRPIFGKRRE